MDRTFKKWIPAVLLVFTPLVIAAAGLPVPEGEQPPAAVIKASMNSTPQAVFPQTKFKFDSVFEGTEIKHDFVVENRGEAPLIITRIRPD